MCQPTHKIAYCCAPSRIPSDILYTHEKPYCRQFRKSESTPRYSLVPSRRLRASKFFNIRRISLFISNAKKYFWYRILCTYNSKATSYLGNLSRQYCYWKMWFLRYMILFKYDHELICLQSLCAARMEMIAYHVEGVLVIHFNCRIIIIELDMKISSYTPNSMASRHIRYFVCEYSRRIRASSLSLGNHYTATSKLSYFDCLFFVDPHKQIPYPGNLHAATHFVHIKCYHPILVKYIRHRHFFCGVNAEYMWRRVAIYLLRVFYISTNRGLVNV